MRRFIPLTLIYIPVMIVLQLFSIAKVSADDGIFPPSVAAKPFIDFDGKGFIVNGKREFIASGTMHYPRVPRALWRDRLMKIKRSGFNCVETYAFWNLHEAQEGKWDFSGEKDFGAFLSLIKELGMYSIVRLGPYVCAEWDSGGFPVWLKFKPGVRVREENAPFQMYTDRWLEKIMPIIAKNQINRGGSVILVQLENEHPLGWGKEMPNGYFKHLREKSLSLGLEVPYFFSGLHHGSDPAGETPWDSEARTNPWFSTEFWPGWYDLYGNLEDSRYYGFVHGFWKVLAHGGNGVNFYMLHGGSNFENWNDNDTAASYDYGAAVGQTGDLRRIGYSFKRIALFARSFPDILENSENATDHYRDFASEKTMRALARKSPAGTVVFLDSRSKSPIPTKIRNDSGVLMPSHAPLLAFPGEMIPILKDYQVSPEVKLNLSAARIMGVLRQGDWTTIITFGAAYDPNPGTPIAANSVGEMDFIIPLEGFKLLKNVSEGEISPGLVRDPSNPTRLTLKIAYPALETVNEYLFAITTKTGAKEETKKYRILAMDRNRMHLTWFAEESGKPIVLSGMDFPGDIDRKDGKLRVRIETGITHVIPHPVAMYTFGSEGETNVLRVSDPKMEKYLTQYDAFGVPINTPAIGEVVLSPWETRRGDRESESNYFAGAWKFSLAPQPMGFDGDTGSYAWYRSTLRLLKAGSRTLNFSDVGDVMTLFVNGKKIASTKPEQRNERAIGRQIPVELSAGENSIAVLTAHNGRNKLFNYRGKIDLIASKGLSGQVTISEGKTTEKKITSWTWRPAEAKDEKLTQIPASLLASADEWKHTAIGQDVFSKKNGYAWFYAELPSEQSRRRRLSFQSVDDNCVVFVNGKRLLEHKGWSDPFSVKLDDVWNEKGKNYALILVQNTDGPGGVTGEVTLTANSPTDGTLVNGWRMRGGLSEARNEREWKIVDDVKGSGTPVFYRANFQASPASLFGPRPIYRLATTGLSRGFAALNGHNLGHYPDKAPSGGIWLPECWLNAGKNTIVIFDMEGAPVNQASVQIETEVSGNRLELISD